MPQSSIREDGGGRVGVDLHKLRVVITAEINDFKKKCEAVKADAKHTVDGANKAFAKIGDNNFASKVNRQWESIRKQMLASRNSVKQFVKTAQIDAGLMQPTKAFAMLEKQIQSSEARLKSLREKQASIPSNDAKVMTKGYEACAERIKATEQRLDSLIEKQESWLGLGINPKSSAAFRQLDEEIEKAHEELEKYKDKQKELENQGQAFLPSERWKAMQKQIAETREEIKRHKAEAANMESAGTAYKPTKKMDEGQLYKSWAAAGKRYAGSIASEAAKACPAIQKLMSLMQKFGNAAKAAGAKGKAALRAVNTAAKFASYPVRMLASGFGKVYQKIKEGIFVIKGFASRTDNLSNSCGKLLGKMGALRITATYMFASSLIMGSINAMKEGFKNLSQYSGRTNADLSMLMSSLTQLKNSLATAFAPVLTVVAPMISTFIDWLSAGMTAIAHFMAAITGKSQVVVAKKANQDFAASIADAGGAADAAAGSIEKYKASLMGFDQVNKLPEPEEGSGGSGKGSGGTAGSASPSDMFETAGVENAFVNWADKFKEAWKNADFTEIGGIVGGKLNAALERINWGKIKATSAKIAKSIATFLNGFIGETDWVLAGGTFAEGINTVLEFGYAFVTTFDWKKFGLAIGDAINGFCATLDLVKAGKTLSEGMKGILDTAIKLIETVDWGNIGENIVNFFASIDYVGVAKKLINGLISAVKGWGDLASSIVDTIAEKISAYIDSGDIWSDVFGILKLGAQLVVSIVGAAWNLLTSLVGGIVNITVTLIKSGWRFLKDFVGDKVEAAVSLARKGWGSLEKFVGNKITAGVNLAKKGWSKLSTWIGSNKTLQAGIKLIKSGWGKIKDWLGISNAFKLSFKLPKIGVKWGSKTLLGFKINYPNGFYTYARGGFPEEGPFMMNRGEIAGKFSNGKTVVANNQQITDGIARAVYSAFSAATAEGAGGGITPAQFEQGVLRIVSTLEHLAFYLDGEELARATVQAQARRDRRFNPVEVR